MSSRRIAVVTGGTRGLGRAISVRLAEDGFAVRMVFRADEDAALETRAHIEAAGGDAVMHRVDVSDPEAVAQFAEEALSGGGVDAVVHSAFRSGRPARKTHDCPIDAWNEDLATNLTGPFLVSRAFLGAMRQAKHGRIVFIGSLAMRGERGRVAYTVAKNGLVGLAKTIAQEYARDGITANVVSPGYIDAGAFRNLDDKIKEAAARRVPRGVLGTAEEVADAVAYFCSPSSGYTNGQVLDVDGGTR